MPDEVDYRAMSDEELRRTFESWYNGTMTYHLILKKWIRELGDICGELGVPMTETYTELKAFTLFVEKENMANMSDNDRFVVDSFVNFILEGMMENSRKVRAAVEAASQQMDEAAGIYRPKKDKDDYDMAIR